MSMSWQSGGSSLLNSQSASHLQQQQQPGLQQNNSTNNLQQNNSNIPQSNKNGGNIWPQSVGPEGDASFGNMRVKNEAMRSFNNLASFDGNQFVERQLQQQLLNQRQEMYTKHRDMLVQQQSTMSTARLQGFHSGDLDTVAAQNLAIEQIARQRSQMSAQISPHMAMGSPMNADNFGANLGASSYNQQLSTQRMDLNMHNMKFGYDFNAASPHASFSNHGNNTAFATGQRESSTSLESRLAPPGSGVFLDNSTAGMGQLNSDVMAFNAGNVGHKGQNMRQLEALLEKDTPAPEPKSSKVLIPQSMLPPELIEQGAEINIVDDLLAITNTPSQFGRFRYKSEQRERPLSAEKGFPEVTLNPAYSHLVAVGAMVTVRIVTKTTNEKMEVLPHYHELGGTSEAPLLGPQRKAVFDNLTVLMSKHTGNKSDTKRNKDDQRACRLLFELQFTSGDKTLYGYVVSFPIFNAKLMINKLSTGFGSCNGQNEVILLCSKVRKATTTVVVSDAAMLEVLGDKISGKVGANTVRHDEAKWTVDSNTGFGFCVLPLRIIQFHHQYAIVIEMPQYHNPNILEGHPINIQIIDFEDGTESAPARYTYIPSEENKQRWTQEHKKRKMDDGMRDFWQQFS